MLVYRKSPVEARPVTTVLCADWLFAALAILGERLEQLAVKRGEVIRFAASRDLPILHHLLIDPIAARIADIGSQRGPRSQRTILCDVGFDQHPGSMANRRYRFAAIEKRPHKSHRLGNNTKRVRIRYPAWQHQGIAVVSGALSPAFG